MNVFRKKSVEQTLAETGESGHALKRDLTWWDLAIMGVAVAVGAGIFSIGAQAAAFHAGPAVVLSCFCNSPTLASIASLRSPSALTCSSRAAPC